MLHFAGTGGALTNRAVTAVVPGTSSRVRDVQLCLLDSLTYLQQPFRWVIAWIQPKPRDPCH